MSEKQVDVAAARRPSSIASAACDLHSRQDRLRRASDELHDRLHLRSRDALADIRDELEAGGLSVRQSDATIVDGNAEFGDGRHAML